MPVEKDFKKLEQDMTAAKWVSGRLLKRLENGVERVELVQQ